jgi:hypothetical protein
MQAAKEGLYISQLLKELMVNLIDNCTQIYCNNTQIIGLINKDIVHLQTCLCHVNIHNHWLWQEVQTKYICVDYVPSGDMLTDRLTKLLLNTSFDQFV